MKIKNPKAILPLKKMIKETLPDTVIDFIFGVYRHKIKHGSFPNIIYPKTFSEKVLYRKLFDRRKLLTQFADKYEVRGYVEQKLGAHILTKLYFVTNKPFNIPFDKLPTKFVVKSTHGSGWVSAVSDKENVNKSDLIETCNLWIGQNYYNTTREWVYKNIEPRIIVEEFIIEEGKDTPNDYKLFVFHGRVALIQVDVGRFTDHRRNFYDTSWNKLDVALEYRNVGGDVMQPRNLDMMISAAELLGVGIDFIRADFYDTGDRIYFGEITNNPGSGLERFNPREFDRYLGGLWTL